MILRTLSLLSRRAQSLRPLWVGLLVASAADASALSMPQRLYGLGRNALNPRPLEQQTDPAGYLPLMGAAPLRFQALPTPPPPRPARVIPAEVKPVLESTLPPEVEPSQAAVNVAEPEPETPAVPTGPKPISILPDDTPRDLRAEDVLPFFQLPMDPGGGPGASVVVPFTPASPAGATVPPSSATYQLK